jgi:hypothetical protein
METWYLLFDGNSPDGRGTGNYLGRTIDVDGALNHFWKTKTNPYSTGYVMIVTDKIFKVAFKESDFPDE